MLPLQLAKVRFDELESQILEIEKKGLAQVEAEEKAKKKKVKT